MFDKFKQLAQLKSIQDNIKKERVEISENGIRVVMDGTFQIIELELNPELDTKEQEKKIKECLNKARDQIQSKLASSLAGSLF